MKKYLIAVALAGLTVGSAYAQDQRTFTSPVTTDRRGETQQRTAPITRTREVGAVPRGVRGGNPAQLVNPAAPARYFAPPEDTVVYSTGDTYSRSNSPRPVGFILFGLRW